MCVLGARSHWMNQRVSRCCRVHGRGGWTSRIRVSKRVVLAAVSGAEFDIKQEVAALREMAQDVCLGPSTRAIVEAAKRRGIPFTRMSTNSLVQLGYGAQQRRICTAENGPYQRDCRVHRPR